MAPFQASSVSTQASSWYDASSSDTDSGSSNRVSNEGTDFVKALLGMNESQQTGKEVEAAVREPKGPLLVLPTPNRIVSGNTLVRPLFSVSPLSSPMTHSTPLLAVPAPVTNSESWENVSENRSDKFVGSRSNYRDQLKARGEGVLQRTTPSSSPQGWQQQSLDQQQRLHLNEAFFPNRTGYETQHQRQHLQQQKQHEHRGHFCRAAVQHRTSGGMLATPSPMQSPMGSPMKSPNSIAMTSPMGAPVDVQDVQRWGQCGNASFGFQDTTYGDISWMNWTDQAMQSQMGVVPAMPGTCGWQDSSCVIAPMPSCVNSEITNWTEAPAPTPASKLNANAPLFVMPQKEMPPDLMAIAMPSAMGGMSKEQIACLLKEAAANECYED